MTHLVDTVSITVMVQLPGGAMLTEGGVYTKLGTSKKDKADVSVMTTKAKEAVTKALEGLGYEEQEFGHEHAGQ
jgi:hypothetical protein